MRVRLLEQIRRFLRLKANQAAIRLNAVWLGAVLALRGLVHRVVWVPRSLLVDLSARQIVAISVLASLILTPTVFFFVERDQRLSQRRAYRALALSSSSEIEVLRASLRDLVDERAKLTEALLDAGYSIQTTEGTVVKVIATGYSSSIFETDSTPFTTASNTRTRMGILALSRDLLKRYTPTAPFDFGDRVHVPGLGEFIVEDSMNSRWNNRIDVWFPSRLEAVRFGVKEVYLRTINEDLRLPEELSEIEPSGDASALQ
jgi:3D (Asp-Asp-Asp) domain-containing protein